MAVFQSPRSHYVLGRYSPHSFMSWVVIVFLVVGGGLAVLSFTDEVVNKELKARPAAGVVLAIGAGGLLCQRGRRVISRVTRETFYGSLHSFTGVCSCDSDGVIGSGFGREQ